MQVDAGVVFTKRWRDLIMSGNLKYLNDDNFKQVIANGVTIVDFYADWCGPCRMIAPIFEELANEWEGKATVAKLNIEDSQKITASLGITSIPTIIVFKDDKEVERVVGIKGKAELARMITAAF